MCLILIFLFLFSFFFLKRNSLINKNNRTIFFKIEAQQLESDLVNKIKIGDRIFDNVKNFYYGEIHDLEIKPATKILENIIDGNFVLSDIKNKNNVYLKIKCDVNETLDGFYIGENSIRLGKLYNLKSKNFCISGYIIDIEISD
jgi:hypothetical protein